MSACFVLPLIVMPETFLNTTTLAGVKKHYMSHLFSNLYGNGAYSCLLVSVMLADSQGVKCFSFAINTVNVVILAALFSLALLPPFKGLWSSDTIQVCRNCHYSKDMTESFYYSV